MQVPTAIHGARESQSVLSTASQHVFVLRGTVPTDFANRVLARGGSIVSSMPEIGVAVTTGLSDADANDIRYCSFGYRGSGLRGPVDSSGGGAATSGTDRPSRRYKWRFSTRSHVPVVAVEHDTNPRC